MSAPVADGLSGTPAIASTPATREIELRTCGSADAAAWDAFVSRATGASVFHRWAWSEVLADSFGHRPHFLGAFEDGRLVGVLPLAEVRTWLFGHTLVSLPFCAHAGALAERAELREALEARASSLARELRVDYLELRELAAPSQPPTQPSSKPSSKPWSKPPSEMASEPASPARRDAAPERRPRARLEGVYASFSREIASDDAANLAAIPRKQRASIRRAQAAGLSAGLADVATLFPLYADNVQRHGTPASPARFLEGLARAFGEDCEVLVVRDASGRPVSGVLALYFRGCCHALVAGDVERARALAANDLKYWALMQRAAARGCTRFDFGRSKVGTGAFDYKRHWGFEPAPIVHAFELLGRNEVPRNNPLNPRYRLLIETWKRLPRFVANALGPIVVRGLG